MAFDIRHRLESAGGHAVRVAYKGQELIFPPYVLSGDILQTLQLVDRYNELRDRYETLFRDTVGIDLAAARERQLNAEKAPITRPATAESITEIPPPPWESNGKGEYTLPESYQALWPKRPTTTAPPTAPLG